MDAVKDRPQGLGPLEILVWRRGYCRGVAKYLRDNGTPAMSGPKPEMGTAEYATWREDLKRRTAEFRTGAHLLAQPYAERALAAYYKAAGIEVVKPVTTRRKVTTKVSAEAERSIRIAVASARSNRSLAVYDAALDIILQALGLPQGSNEGVKAA